MKIMEAHAHIEHNEDIDLTVSGFQTAMSALEYDDVHILTVNHFVKEIPSGDVTRNLKALYCKEKLNCYASYGLFHHFNELDTRKEFGTQAKRAYELGFDGYKMLEGKPGFHRGTRTAVDNPIYWDFYEFAEENAIPIVLHSADPAHYWHYELLTEYQKNAGWFCDSSLPTKDEFRQAIWGIMKNFPQLKLTLAHMGFLHDEPEYLCEFLETWENTAIDLTPNDYEIFDMTKNIPYWKDFFEKYQDRIIFGTDFYPFEVNEETFMHRFGRTIRLRAFLEKADPDTSYLGQNVHAGLELPKDILEKLYFDNHVIKYGARRTLDYASIRNECERILSERTYTLTDLDINNLQKMSRYFSSLIK